jgi:hypothetical protein
MNLLLWLPVIAVYSAQILVLCKDSEIFQNGSMFNCLGYVIVMMNGRDSYKQEVLWSGEY